jgi:hypothetical protein
VIKKEAEKILKYKDLTIETERIWNVKAKVIPVFIGTTGTISKSLRQYLSNRPGEHEIKKLKKRTIEHCTQAEGSADVKLQSIQNGK